MLDISLLFKIGAFGILLMILEKVLKASGKDEIAMIANITGIVIILTMVIRLISQLFSSVRTMFTI
ncbi:stage III sporulation protein AC [Clostridium sp. YIM B02515]|jgi:stage III sporulation protein AC|uniref:Stage III sporulation protein AC n=1 Tax=Clostridium rhizosphaerae TaxID=2803861 RepID=A0ABS1TF41_9CLOT|nr:stage III sporulation protein AC [Clostridium rhizosphaerae]MBL4937915.1 stage III sporulation protein AC [Clostridium rhizosphaerae]